MHLLLGLLLLPPLSITYTIDLSEYNHVKYLKLSKLLEEYYDFKKMIITDNATIHYLDKFIAAVSTKSRGLLVINTDVTNISSNSQYNNYIQVIIFENISKYEKIKNSLHFYKSVMIFLISQHAAPNICTRITNCPEFIYSLSSSNLYICNQKSGTISKVLHYGTDMDSIYIFTIIEGFRRDYYYNFKGHNLIVAFDNSPSSISEKNISGKLQADGVDYKLFELISRRLNFKFTLKEFRGYNLTASKSQAIKALGQKKVDVVLGGLTLTHDRAVMFDFVSPYQYTYFMAFYLMNQDRYPTVRDLVWDKLVKTCFIPLLVFSAVVFGCLLKISTILFKNNPSTPKHNMNVVLNILIGLSDPVLTIYKNIPYRTSIKFVFLFWLIMKVAVDVYFSGIFRSYIMSQNYTKFDINDLMNKEYTFVLNPNDYDYINNWCYHSTLPLCKLFITKGIYSGDRCENLMKPNHALIIENLPAYAFVDNLNDLWNNQNTVHDVSKCTFVHDSHLTLGFTKVFVGDGYQTFLVPKTSPFEPAFSNTVVRLYESGMIQHWASIERRMMKRFKKAMKNRPQRVSMKLDKLMFAFEIWLFGIICSFLIFVAENRKFHFQNKQNH